MIKGTLLKWVLFLLIAKCAQCELELLQRKELYFTTFGNYIASFQSSVRLTVTIAVESSMTQFFTLVSLVPSCVVCEVCLLDYL